MVKHKAWPPAAPPASPTAAAATGVAGAGAATGGLDFDALTAAAPDPRQFVKTVSQAGGWTIDEAGDKWQITVSIGALRKQIVTVDFNARDEEGHRMIAYSSICGPASERNAMLLLRFNLQMVHGAFAVQETSAGEMVVVQANQLAETADTLEVTRLITAVAWQADRAEEKLLGQDQN